MTLFKRIASAITAAVISFTAVSGSFPASASATEPETAFLSNDDVKISGTNSFGTMVANEFAQVSEKQLENNGYNVFSIEMENNIAVVSYEAAQECSLVVAVYDDAGETMLGSGEVKVSPEENTTFVKIEIAAMPEYFSLKAFMVDPNTLRPKCEAFNSPMYTKAMQEFLSKTTADFDEDRVLNLDEDETKNFAVFSENVKLIHSSGTVNTPEVGTPDESGVTAYAFTNCDAELSEVSEGNVFAVIYEEEIIIAEAVSVQSNGSSAVILGQDAEMENAFEHININAKADSEDAVVDDSTLDERLEYVGAEYIESKEENVGAVSTYGDDPGIVTKLTHKIKFKKPDEEGGGDDDGDDDKPITVDGKVSGGLDICITAGAVLCFNEDVDYVEMSLSYEINLYITFEGEFNLDVPLLQFTFSPIIGVYIELVPKFVVNISAEFTLNGSLTGSIGFRAYPESGDVADISKSPNLDVIPELNIEGFVGLKLEPKIVVVSEKVASVTLTASAGINLKAEFANDQSDPDVEHMCEVCIKGTITPTFSLGVAVEFIFLSAPLDGSFTIDLKPINLYKSLSFGDFGFTTCPHAKCKTTISVVNEKKIPINGATFYDYNDKGTVYTIGAEGKESLMLQNGRHFIIAEADGYYSSSLTFDVANKAAAYTLTLQSEDGDSAPDEPPVVIGPGWDFDGETDEPGTEEPGTEETIVTQVEIGGYNSAVITENGDLYSWGNNWWGVLGNGTADHNICLIPTKIMSNVKLVSLGETHSAAITENGDLYTWGRNDYGQLGNGTTTAQSEANPIPIKIMSNVKSVSLGSWHGAAITENGDLYTWGYNSYGQLGNGTTESSSTPIKIMSNVKSVSLGSVHSAAITENGDLYTWGSNWDGELGNGTTEYICSIPTKIMSNVKSVSLGEDHSAAITKNGDLYTWGDNELGQLGNGTTTDVFTSNPTPIKIMSNIKAVSLGKSASAAVTKNGDLYTWGSNSCGKLGNGTTEDSYIPIKIMSNVKSVSLGWWSHSAAITQNGDLYSWGYNSSGQLGNGTTEDSYIPIKIVIGKSEESEGPVTEETTLPQVELGGYHSAVITENGDLYTWGYNRCGQLGNGTATWDEIFPIPNPTPIKIMSNVKSVSLGDFHSAAITENGDLYTWGYNIDGQLGNGKIGDKEYCSTPIKIMSNIKSVVLGSYHSAAITENCDLYTWGWNDNGQIGNGTTEVCSTPIKIMSNVKSVSLGGSHSAAITENGDLYIWGDNEHGQLGNGTTEDSYIPVKIMSNVKSVSLGSSHSAAITENSDLYTWGYNRDGQLGNKTTENSFTPIKIMGNVKSISLGNWHSATITENGDLYIWGDNEYGQLGNGRTRDSSIPIKIMNNVKVVGLGGVHSATITKYDNLYTWGSNSCGRLGSPRNEAENIPGKVMLTIAAPTALSAAHMAYASANGHTVSYKNLTPNTVYNFYSLRASAAQNLLSSDNLLYITQAVSDEDGKLTITFSPTEEVEGAVNVLRSIERIDIADTVVDIPSQNADGTVKIAEPNVSYNDRPLEMGRDYLMSGGFSATTPGKYILTLTGTGDFMGETDVEWELLSTGSDWYTISGAITSSGDADALATVELRNAEGETVDTATGTTAYSFENVASGTYTLIVSKTKHCPREYTITVDGSNVEKDVEIWLYGDVNHDGKPNPSDVTQILRYCSKSKSIFDKGDDETKQYRILVASVINPGAAPTARDATQILRYTNRRSSVFDKLQ